LLDRRADRDARLQEVPIMEATRLLQHDHDGVRGLFAAFQNAGDDHVAQAELFSQLREAIDVHATMEEEVFYPAIRECDGKGNKGHTLVKEAHEEHDEVRQLLAECALLDPADKKFARTVKKLEHAVEHHAGEEEKEMFAFARAHIDAALLEEIGVRLERRKKELSTRDPHAQVRM
jgi:hemerythrin superfamily protein